MGYVTAGLLNELVSADFLKELVPAGLLMTRSRQVTKSKARLGKVLPRPGVNLLHALWATAGHEIESEAGQSIASTWGHPSSRALPGHGGSRDRKRGWTVKRWQSILSFDLGNCSD